MFLLCQVNTSQNVSNEQDASISPKYYGKLPIINKDSLSGLIILIGKTQICLPKDLSILSGENKE